MRLGRSFICALIAGIFLAPRALAEPVISGMVTDQSHNPVAGVNVSVWDEETSWSESTRTDEEGKFMVKHKPCKLCFVEFDPRTETGLAPAIFERVPGNKMRQMLIELRHGFTIKGKVKRASGGGLKGVVVKAEEAEKQTGKSSIHGRTVKITKGDGSFSMVLTPGKKRLTVLNQRYSNLIERVDQQFVVTTDGVLDDIVLTGKNQ